MQSAQSHEVSSVFMYSLIHEYGGVEKFYNNFYINSPFPLAIVREREDGKFLNANYYDNPELLKATEDFMIETLRLHLDFGIDNKVGFVLGKKNAQFIQKINKKAKLFDKLVALEHPRYIQQYKSKEKLKYIDNYILTLNSSS